MVVLVVGAGGNGQSYFMEFLKSNKIITNSPGDKDRIKHLNSPLKTSLQDIDKCIFLYNDPYKSIVSLFRRKWQIQQLNKLGNPFKLKKEDIKDINSFLELVKENKKDIFGIEYQFDNWINSKLTIPILFLNFNDVLLKKDLLDKFLGTKLNYNNFKTKKRSSDETLTDDSEIFGIYNKLYKKIINESENFNKSMGII